MIDGVVWIATGQAALSPKTDCLRLGRDRTYRKKFSGSAHRRATFQGTEIARCSSPKAKRHAPLFQSPSATGTITPTGAQVETTIGSDTYRIELVLSLPTIPIWLALAAALPQDWPATLNYLMITVILSLTGWAQLARVVRGRFLSLRTEEFVTAARLDGASEGRIIFRHMLPSFSSHIIASVSLAIPAMILAETSLSFLGLGLQPPTISWGVLLREAQNIRSIATAPWLFAPGAAVVLAVIALNFLGDGLRDASDPYNK